MQERERLPSFVSVGGVPTGMEVSGLRSGVQWRANVLQLAVASMKAPLS